MLGVIGNVLTYATQALAYYLYLAYAEEIVVEYERGTERLAPRDVLRELRDATSYVWRTLAAGLMTLVTTGVAASLLVVPGPWEDIWSRGQTRGESGSVVRSWPR